MKSLPLIPDFDARSGIERWENEGGRIPRGVFDSFAPKRDDAWLGTPQDRSELSELAVDDPEDTKCTVNHEQ
jgi:hypothetical protein